MTNGIGILKPGEAGARAKARVAEWEAGQRKAGVEAKRAKPEPEKVAVVPTQMGNGAPEKVVHDKETQKMLDRKLKEFVKDGNEERAIKVIKAGANPNSYFHRNDTILAPLCTGHNVGATVLMAAAMKGSVRIVEALLDAGAEIDKECHTGATAAAFAMIAGKDEAARLLSDKGADMVRATQTVRNYLGSDMVRLPTLSYEERTDILHRIMGSIVW